MVAPWKRPRGRSWSTTRSRYRGRRRDLAPRTTGRPDSESETRPRRSGRPGPRWDGRSVPADLPTPAGLPDPAGQADARPTGPDDGRKRSHAGKTYSFHLTIGPGPRPIEIRGSFTVARPAARQRRDQDPLRTDPAYFPAVARMTRNRVPAAQGAVDLQAAALVVDHAVGDAQAQAGAVADALGGEERVEDVREHVAGDAAAIVGHLDDDLAVNRAGADRDPPVDPGASPRWPARR